MIFTDTQIQELLSILEYQSAYLVATNMGTDMLTSEEITILSNFDTSVQELYQKFPPSTKAFMFGRLTELLGDVNSKAINYTEFKEHLSRGQYMPLSRREKSELNLVRKMSCTHIRGLGTRIKQTVEGIIFEEDLKLHSEYEKVLKKEMSEAVVNKKALTSIISEIGHKTEDWNKDWGRIVDTEMNNIFQSGRSQSIIEREGEDAEVYKLPQDDACRHCIRLYLTNGVGSQPKIFKMKDMIAFGTNVGRKVADWKPVVGSVHSHCRCILINIPKGQKWNQDKGVFEYPKEIEHKVKRKSKIKVEIGDKKFLV